MSTDQSSSSNYPGEPSAPRQEGTPLQAPPVSQTPVVSTFQAWIKDNEISREMASHLVSVVPRIKVVMLVDDSSSMGAKIVEPGANMNLFANNQNQKTRWMEAQQAAITAVNLVTSLHGEYLMDCWFLNRGTVKNVGKAADLAPFFNTGPSGGTPLITTLNAIFSTYSSLVNRGVHVLVLALSDGEPSDGSINALVRCLTNKPNNIHFSMVECNDNEEEMAAFDALDGQIHNYHSSDDYRMELGRVKGIQGQGFNYTYTHYIISAVLSTFIPTYFLLDQQKTARVTITPLPPMRQSDIDAYLNGAIFVERGSRAPVEANLISLPQSSQQYQAVPQQAPGAQYVAPQAPTKCCTIL